jgi:hypothetical protein
VELACLPGYGSIAAVSNEQTPPKKRGCFFYGCLSLVVLSLVLVLIGYLGYRRLITWVVTEYTDTKPELIESVEVSPAQFQALQKRVADFKAALDGQKVSQELRLTAEDINALIANDPGAKQFKNKLFVMIDGDRVSGKVSWPLDDIWRSKLKGRYLNGVATFKTSLESGVLLVTLEDLKVKGKPLPAQMLAQFKNQNLAQDVQHDAETARTIQKFDSIQVTNGAVVLKSRER